MGGKTNGPSPPPSSTTTQTMSFVQRKFITPFVSKLAAKVRRTYLGSQQANRHRAEHVASQVEATQRRQGFWPNIDEQKLAQVLRYTPWEYLLGGRTPRQRRYQTDQFVRRQFRQASYYRKPYVRSQTRSQTYFKSEPQWGGIQQKTFFKKRRFIPSLYNTRKRTQIPRRRHIVSYRRKYRNYAKANITRQSFRNKGRRPYRRTYRKKNYH